ncbi:hypothetical protein [Halococcus sp. AFM35]|uniref:hypothetical protein n=1 Tax=Halococcus sp. AFM35 TaxID=3421653 RepID=UPI003EBB2804
MPEHGDGPGFIETWSAEDARAVFDEVPNAVVTAADVANALGCSDDSARRKLKELEHEADVKRRNPSARSVLWYVPIENGSGRGSENDQSPIDVLGGNDSETILKMLSLNLGESITVGDVVYEDGDKHPVEDAD